VVSFRVLSRTNLAYRSHNSSSNPQRFSNLPPLCFSWPSFSHPDRFSNLQLFAKHPVGYPLRTLDLRTFRRSDKRSSFVPYHISATPAFSSDCALFSATAPAYPSFFQQLAHSFALTNSFFLCAETLQVLCALCVNSVGNQPRATFPTRHSQLATWPVRSSLQAPELLP